MVRLGTSDDVFSGDFSGNLVSLLKPETDRKLFTLCNYKEIGSIRLLWLEKTRREKVLQSTLPADGLIPKV